MPQTVKAKLLLGWMSRHEAMEALNSCVFNEHLSDKKAVALWKHYRDKVSALEPRIPAPLQEVALTATEQSAVEDHIRRINATPKGQFAPRVIKVHPGELIAKQFHVLTDRSEKYAQEMQNESNRINNCLGVGLQFNGQLVFRHVGRNRIDVDLPHPEYLVIPRQVGSQTQFEFQERDRYILAVRTAGDRLLLWGGYHRTYALLCHMAGDAAGVAPLLTVMTGIAEVESFLTRPSFVRETVLGDRPALLRDFLDEELFITVNLRKRRARGRVELVRPGKFRWKIDLVNDDT